MELSKKEVYEFLFTSSEGYRFYATKEGSEWNQISIEAKNFVSYLLDLEGSIVNEYVSFNVLKSSSRRASNLKYFTNIVIDIDAHSEILPQYWLEEFVGLVKEELGFEYTLCTYSGRGLHFWFALEQEGYNTEAKKQYEYVVDTAIARVESILRQHPDFGMLEVDKKFSKVQNGVVRLPYSYNATAGKHTKVEFHAVRYSLNRLAAYLGYKVKETESESAKEQKTFIEQAAHIGKKKSSKQRTKVTASGFKAQDTKRVALIEQVVRDRREAGWKSKTKEPGELRHNTLLLYYNSLLGLVSKEEAKKKTEELNNQFITTFPPSELKAMFKYVDGLNSKAGFNRYKYSNKRFIETLQLSKEEQARYNFYEAGAKKEKFNYSECVPHMTRDAERKAKAKGRNLQIINLYEEGYTKVEIAKELCLDRQTVSKVIKDEGLSDSDNNIRVKQAKRKGYTQEKVAKNLGLGIATVKRYWNG